MGFTWGDEDKKYLEIQKKAVAKCIAVEQKYKNYGFATPTFSFPNDEFSLELPLAERRTKENIEWISEMTGAINNEKRYVDLEKYLKEMLRNPHKLEETDPKKIFIDRTNRILTKLEGLGFKKTYYHSATGNKYITMLHPFYNAIYNVCQVDKEGNPNGIDAHYLFLEDCFHNKRDEEVLNKPKLRKNQYDWFDKNRPYVNAFQYEKTIPYVLREKNVFVGWKLEWDEYSGKKVHLQLTDFDGNTTSEVLTYGKYKKVPYNCKTGAKARVNDFHTWCNFKEACEGIRKHKLDGIGIILGKYKLLGIDIDHCIDENGELSQSAKEAIDKINGYTEWSPSGDGIHIICFADMDAETFNNKNAKTGFEAYGNGRFFTLSGNVIEGKIKMVKQSENQDNVNTILEKYLQRRNSEVKAFDKTRLGTQSKKIEKQQGFRKTIICEHDESFGNTLGLSDTDILDKLMKQGERLQKDKGLSKNPFEKLYYHGDISDYGSSFHPEGDPSSADYGLASQILYYTTSKAQCERLMRNSAIYREKYERISGGTTYLYNLVETVDAKKVKRWSGKVSNKEPIKKEIEME